MDEKDGKRCLTDNTVYLKGLLAAIETRAGRFQNKLNEIVKEVSETATRLDASVFRPMPAQRFFDIHEPFPMDDEANSALKWVQLDVTRITVSAPLEEDTEALPTMGIRLEGMTEDDRGYSVDLDELVFEAMEYPFRFGCDDIVGIDGGCRGTVFVDLRSDGKFGATPVIVGFSMLPMTEKQAKKIAFRLLAPRFSGTSEKYDAARMKEAAELF